MRNLLTLIFLVFSAVAFTAPAPYHQKDVDIIDNKVVDLADGAGIIGNSSGKAIAGAGNGQEGIQLFRVARFEYDITGGDSGAIGAHGLGVKLPANALLIRSFFRVDTVFSDSGAGTVALSCEDANNIYSAADITGISTGVLTTGIHDGFDDITTVGSAIAAECEITATVATAAQDAGKLTGWVFFLDHE